MSTQHEEEALGKAYDSRLMRRLLRYMKPYAWRVVLDGYRLADLDLLRRAGI